MMLPKHISERAIKKDVLAKRPVFKTHCLSAIRFTHSIVIQAVFVKISKRASNEN